MPTHDPTTSQRIRQDWNESVPWAYLEPMTQNIPLGDPLVRPPPPRVPTSYDIFIGISAYRDGVRCGFTLFTAFSRAKHPHRVHIGLVDQTQDDDARCVDEYCALAAAAGWPEPCLYKDQIRVDARDARRSKGPTLARWQQQQLIQDEEFCLAIDAHSQFLADWDVVLVDEWLRTDNEMAVLTSYPMGYNWMGPNQSRPTHYSSHLCAYMPRANVQEIPIIAGWKAVDDSEMPQMAALWGGCLSFSKCHAERRAQNDKHMNWVFWGEEYLRSMQLWTRGYDLYSPSRHGSVVFHNWSDDKGTKKRFWDNVTQVMTKDEHDKEEQLAYNRLRMVLTLPFEGPVDATEIDTYHGGKVRTVEQFLAFSGISNVDPTRDEARCEQLHWVPYAVPEIIESLLPGWTMRASPATIEGTTTTTMPPLATVAALAQVETQPPSWHASFQSQLDQVVFVSSQLDETLQAMQRKIDAWDSRLPLQPATDLSPLLVPVAFVWLTLLSAWLVYSRRRHQETYEPVRVVDEA
ncbi:Aste57867_21672 [Aphanomyces stellatus]|uniref:Aste57867_21672 protein n=1 Tax=Aphanomyces stellatus TaxID=120398 RepID=A0A485LI51_9STRA|nr:hypothetical protein As57867_021603 [Aphanomyces stellatus]VFT98341.1 Aste57867_21672 [Aphanomyces stellatus]